jgi:cyclic beta-1,2-glucan synthetase
LEVTERLEATMTTISTLARYEGHLFNWYDTHDLRPLDPLYVSTVDSGNLAGHLWAASNACRELAANKLSPENIFLGLRDTLTVIQDTACRLTDDRRAETVTSYHLEEAMAILNVSLERSPGSPAELKSRLDDLKEKSGTLADIARALWPGNERHKKKKS